MYIKMHKNKSMNITHRFMCYAIYLISPAPAMTAFP